MATKRGKVRDRARKKDLRKKKEGQLAFKRKTLEKIRKWNDPILKERCDEVEEWEDISALKKDMARVLTYSKSGVGLAAPQIGVTKRVIAVLLDRTSLRFLINPQIEWMSEDITKNKEGCLSYPGVEAEVERHISITVKYIDETGNIQNRTFKGFNSVVIQHEVDHLNGICKVGDEWKKTHPEPRLPSSSA